MKNKQQAFEEALHSNLGDRPYKVLVYKKNGLTELPETFYEHDDAIMYCHEQGLQNFIIHYTKDDN